MQYVNPKFPTQIISDGSPYVCPVSGTQYPRGWDISTIPGLIPIADEGDVDREKYEVGPPTLMLHGGKAQWSRMTTELTPEEIAARTRQRERQTALSSVRELEREMQTPRAVRGALLGIKEDIERLLKIEEQASLLRAMHHPPDHYG